MITRLALWWLKRNGYVAYKPKPLIPGEVRVIGGTITINPNRPITTINITKQIDPEAEATDPYPVSSTRTPATSPAGAGSAPSAAPTPAPATEPRTTPPPASE